MLCHVLWMILLEQGGWNGSPAVVPSSLTRSITLNASQCTTELQLPACPGLQGPTPAARAPCRVDGKRGAGRECESGLAGARPAFQRAGQQEAAAVEREAARRGAAPGESPAEPPPHPSERRVVGPRPGRELKRDRFNARFDDVIRTNEAAALPSARLGPAAVRSSLGAPRGTALPTGAARTAPGSPVRGKPWARARPSAFACSRHSAAAHWLLRSGRALPAPLNWRGSR